MRGLEADRGNYLGRLVPMACVAIVAWLYWPVVGNGLVWDDPIYLRGYPQYWMPELWLRSFTEPLFFIINIAICTCPPLDCYREDRALLNQSPITETTRPCWEFYQGYRRSWFHIDA